MKKYKNSAFTLVELIVVITILAILGTIAFISLQGYSAQSRDSVRITDMASMKTSLELFQLDAGKYPLPTDGIEITYSGGLTWTQGYFGEQTYKNVDSLDQIPLDPLTDKKYVYSTTNTRQEFQLAGVMEGEEVTLNQLTKTNAGEKIALVKISGNYNGKLLKVSTGGIDYVLAIPSLMTSSGDTDVVTIVSNDTLAYNGYKNLPIQYDGGKYNVNGDSGISLINAASLVVYSGSLSLLSSAEAEGITARLELLTNMQDAYTGTTIKNVGGIARILSTDVNDSDATELLTTNIVSNNLGGSIIASLNSTDALGTPLIEQTLCESSGWHWITALQDNQGDGFCISPRIEGGTEYISWNDIGTAYNWNASRTGSLIATNLDDLTQADSNSSNSTGITYDLGNYTCKPTGTSISGLTLSDGDNSNLSDNPDSVLSADDLLENRMRYLAKYRVDNTKLDDVNIDWISVPLIPAGFTIPSLYLSDCIDGVRDLNTGKTYDGVTYEEYSNPASRTSLTRTKMNKYLLGWTNVPGSHLPSAYSDISNEIGDNLTGVARGEYQVACDLGILNNTLNKWIFLSAVGSTTGIIWGSVPRTLGYFDCSDQSDNNAGVRSSNTGARFVVRP